MIIMVAFGLSVLSQRKQNLVEVFGLYMVCMDLESTVKYYYIFNRPIHFVK